MNDELDMHAVQRDAELLDALAAREPVDQADTAARLLAALAVDVDSFPVPLAEAVAAAAPADAMPVLFPMGEEVTEVNGTPVLPAPGARPGRHRRHVSRAVLASGVAGTVLVGSMAVAAAVSGDPLAPVRRVIDVVSGTDTQDKVPAQVDRDLEQARDELAQGDTAAAEDKIAELRELLSGLEGDEADAMREQLAILEAWLVEQLATPAATQGPAPTDEPVATEPAPEPEPTVAPEPTQEPTPEPGPGDEPTSEPTDEPAPPTEPEPTPTETYEGSTQSGPGAAARSSAPGQQKGRGQAGEHGKAGKAGKAGPAGAGRGSALDLGDIVGG